MISKIVSVQAHHCFLMVAEWEARQPIMKRWGWIWSNITYYRYLSCNAYWVIFQQVDIS